MANVQANRPCNNNKRNGPVAVRTVQSPSLKQLQETHGHGRSRVTAMPRPNVDATAPRETNCKLKAPVTATSVGNPLILKTLPRATRSLRHRSVSAAFLLLTSIELYVLCVAQLSLACMSYRCLSGACPSHAIALYLIVVPSYLPASCACARGFVRVCACLSSIS